MYSFYSFLLIFSSIYSIVCFYRIFTNCGELGYKAIIPIYSTYIQFKLFYSKKNFFIYIVFYILGTILNLYLYFYSIVNLDNPSAYSDIYNLLMITFLVNLICGLYKIFLSIWMARSFNENLIYGFLLCIPYIRLFFLSKIAYKNTYYNGNKYIEYKEISKKFTF